MKPRPVAPATIAMVVVVLVLGALDVLGRWHATFLGGAAVALVWVYLARSPGRHRG